MAPWHWLARFSRLKQRGGALARIARAFRVFGPMCLDVVKGRYRPVPWAAFGWMALAVVYLVSPLDLIPDFIAVLGLADDVVIVGWLLTRVDRSLADYRRWRGWEEDGAPTD
ncbi:YkvA family protein [Salinicola rhizosphaerae]|uniref:DUF1232 domain-containing protein n=1 Tax=Salinicola rhizosphaerae TaxID=1443141 RepID=A0ABQ3EBS1_9GAMM|nr:DUF1232 domain-containing protein [Salinicola rhizosphaerae]GHB29884.1 hypothetical protein GCM10009038_30770 [Salinicola rhizosphaerae]